MRARRILTGVVAIAMVVGGATVTQAASESGTRNCAYNQIGRTHATSYGTTHHYPPGGGYGVFYNGLTYKSTSKYGSRHSDSPNWESWWSVTTDGGMQSASGTCVRV